ncbi:MAG: cyclic lactone autoinducer peptide [Firmicutes bacterium]|nr:cyclic lactone autoinducer peptide [Bacillota bacterium]
MLARLKNLLFTPVVLAALFVAAMGVKPASYFTWYQPAPPRE